MPLITTDPGTPPASTPPKDVGLWGEMGDGVAPRQSPPGYPVNSPHAAAIARPPTGVLPIPSGRMNGHHGNPKWEGDSSVTPPRPHPALAPLPSGHMALPPRMLPGTKGCFWGLKDAPRDGRQEDAYFWHPWVVVEAGWVLLHPRSGSPSCRPRAVHPPSPRPCPWGARRFLLVNRMFFAARPPAALACSLASVSWYGRLQGTWGGEGDK